MIKYLTFILIIAVPTISSAQTRISLNADYSRFSIGFEDYSQNFSWNFVSAEAEYQFKHKWLPGFALGILREGKENEYSGTYFTTKFFHAFDLHNFSILASGGFIYGLPGTQFDRTKLIYENGKVVGYKHISMIRHINISQTQVDTAGILQPISELAIRKYFGRYFLESHANLRFARFAKVSSDFSNADYQETLIIMPSLGGGIGFTF